MIDDRDLLELLELELAELRAEQKAAILYGVDLPREELDRELLFLSVATVHELLGYEMDALAEKTIRWQNETIISGRDADLVLAPRGGGKSTTATITRAIWYVLRDHDIRILLASDTEAAGKKFLHEIKTHLETNNELIMMFERFQPTTLDKGKVWDVKSATIRQRQKVHGEPTFTVLGVGGQGASRHFEVIFPDDIVTLRSSKTKNARKALDDWYGSTLQGCAISGTIFHHSGTRYFPGDQWDALMNGRAGETRGALSGMALVVPAITTDERGVEKSFSSRVPIDFLRRRRELAGEAHFAAQYQQDTSKMEGKVWKYQHFQWYDETERADTAEFEKWPVFLYFDLAAKHTEAGDYFAGVAIAASPDKSKVYVLDLIRFRGGIGEQRDAIIRWTKKWRPIYSGVEAVQMQAGFAEEIRDRKLIPVSPREKKMDKFLEAQQVAHLTENGKVFFPLRSDGETVRPAGDRVHAMVEEMLAFNDGDHDDTVDAYVGACLEVSFGFWNLPPATGLSAGDRTSVSEGLAI